MIKNLFFDIDGTLCDIETHRPSEQTLRDLAELHRRGFRLFIATGRHCALPEQMHVLDGFPDVFDGMIGLNGQIAVRRGGEVVYCRPFPAEAALRVLDFCSAHDVPFQILERGRIYQRFESEVIDRFNQAAGFERNSIDPSEPTGEGILMFTLYAALTRHDEAWLTGCRVMWWADWACDVVPEVTGKHLGMAAFGRLFGFGPAETMAFGDEGNDISMLRAAGIGVAMGNAKPAVKAAADYVTDAIENEGLHKALVHFGLLEEEA